MNQRNRISAVILLSALFNCANAHAAGHEFYDSLAADGSPGLTYKNIWFFSKTGTEQHFDGNNDLAKCTAQKPCSNITQKTIDRIQELRPGALLWFSKGNYSLPLTTEQNTEARVLYLYNKQRIMGRSADFKQPAKNNQRPVFNGTLAWTGYINHEGYEGWVDSIEIVTKENFLESVDGERLNTNLYATGNLQITNTVLISKDNVENPLNDPTIYANIYGETVSLSDSDLDVNANRSIGIIAARATLATSQIITSGYSAIGLMFTDLPDSNSPIQNHINSIENIDLTISGRVAVGVSARGDNILLNTSKISGDAAYFSAGILNSTGISSINASELDIRSEFLASGISVSDCYFTGAGSSLNVSAPFGSLFSLSGENAELVNMSTPPSRCKLNDEDEHDCQYIPEAPLVANEQALAEIKNMLEIKRFKAINHAG